MHEIGDIKEIMCRPILKLNKKYLIEFILKSNSFFKPPFFTYFILFFCKAYFITHNTGMN